MPHLSSEFDHQSQQPLCNEKSKSHPFVQSFVFIDINTDINQFSLSRHYKWVTSLQLISAQQFQERMFVKGRQELKQKGHRQDYILRHFRIDKLLYLAVGFCQENKLPISRIRMMKYSPGNDWNLVQYPKILEQLYEYSICYQMLQSKQCKRIITDLEICQGKDLQDVGRGTEWEISKVPEIGVPKLNTVINSNDKQSADNRATNSLQSNDQKWSSQEVCCKNHNFHSQNICKAAADNEISDREHHSSQSVSVNEKPNTLNNGGNSKLSDRSWANEISKNHSNLSESSYYSYNDKSQSIHNASIQKDNFSDLDEVMSPSLPSNLEKHSLKSSFTQFHSIQEEIYCPLYFLMKTVDLYECHNQFQYVYQPKIKEIIKHPNSNLQEFNLMALSKFCFPNGIKLSKKITGCGYEIFTLILTTCQGERYFVYCLKYKEKMSHHMENKLIQELLQLNLIQKNQIKPNRHINSEKALCLVTKLQNTDAFVQILEHLYRVYLSFKDNINNEYFEKKSTNKQSLKSTSVKNQVSSSKKNDQQIYPKVLQFFANNLIQYFNELQVQSIQPFWKMPSSQMHSLAQIQAQKCNFKWCGSSIYLPMPTKNQTQNNLASSRASSKALYCLLKLLSVENIAIVLMSLLLEKKIFIVSNVQTNIGYAMQAILGMLYPLRWSQTVIPIICQEMMDYIDAPFPMIAGLKEQDAGERTLSKGIHVFLDCNQVLSFDQLPRQPQCIKFLKIKMKKHYQFYNSQHVQQLLRYKEQIYTLTIHQKTEYTEQMHIQIQELFLNCILSILQNYEIYYSKQAIQNIQARLTQQIKKQLAQSNQIITASLNDKKNHSVNAKMSLAPSTKASSVMYSSTKSIGPNTPINPSSQPSKIKHLTFNKMYNSDGFVKSHMKGQFAFYKEFIESGIFKNLVQTKFHNPKDQQIVMIEKQMEKIEVSYVNSLSCWTIPSIKKKSKASNSRLNGQISDFIIASNVKEKRTKAAQKQSFDNRTSLTGQKESNIMRKNKSQQQPKSSAPQKKMHTKAKYEKKLARQTLFPETDKMKQQEEKFPQRYSEGGPHRENPSIGRIPEQLMQERMPKLEQKSSMGQNICTLVENVTRRLSQSGQNIVGIFSEAKVQRLKQLSKEENKQGHIKKRAMKQQQTQKREHQIMQQKDKTQSQEKDISEAHFQSTIKTNKVQIKQFKQ